MAPDRPRDGIDRLLDDLTWEETGIRLVPDELLLLDWVLSAPSRILPGADDLDGFMKWEKLRDRLWAQLNTVVDYLLGDDDGYLGLQEKAAKAGLYLTLSVPEAHCLLALVPTTFRWGTAPDSGFSLKAKLSLYIGGVYHDPQRDEDKAQAEGAAEGEAGAKPTA